MLEVSSFVVAIILLKQILKFTEIHKENVFKRKFLIKEINCNLKDELVMFAWLAIYCPSGGIPI